MRLNGCAFWSSPHAKQPYSNIIFQTLQQLSPNKFKHHEELPYDPEFSNVSSLSPNMIPGAPKYNRDVFPPTPKLGPSMDPPLSPRSTSVFHAPDHRYASRLTTPTGIQPGLRSPSRRWPHRMGPPEQRTRTCLLTLRRVDCQGWQSTVLLRLRPQDLEKTRRTEPRSLQRRQSGGSCLRSRNLYTPPSAQIRRRATGSPGQIRTAASRPRPQRTLRTILRRGRVMTRPSSPCPLILSVALTFRGLALRTGRIPRGSSAAATHQWSASTSAWLVAMAVTPRSTRAASRRTPSTGTRNRRRRHPRRRAHSGQP